MILGMSLGATVGEVSRRGDRCVAFLRSSFAVVSSVAVA